MEAVRLIGVGRRALAESQDAPDIMREAWQAQALAQAIGSRLAMQGPAELRGDALGLAEAGARGSGGSAVPIVGAGGIRAAQLTELGDVRRALVGLGALLGDVGIALVGVASESFEEGAYWQCMEAIDAADESRDRVLEILRRLPERDGRLSGPEPAPDSDSAA
ncbi:DUF6099 family protein [Streptomyces sp. VRA16 Mangrove soil]|uniref:DUF6099 family protein n=1 Tax=Streptomyces sp. VRA16 Mangrove soil TaxID=2817434 RepID=UPI001A9CD697|nr:DUF6099 family protein [Streptomyces sp. VRA16 Mangrove soil]MBO1335642.1 hypothetical protein [Streptomyces sp. VRA16 Mangrove soil]